MKTAPIAAFLAAAAILSFAGQTEQDTTERQKLAVQMDQKLAYIRSNAARSEPDTKPTELSQAEVNAYFAESRVKMPRGVKSVTFDGTPGTIEGVAKVDFDEIVGKSVSMNPLLMMFSGVHDVRVVAKAKAEAGEGVIEVDSVEMDGMQLPRVALEYFVERFITPRYPNVGMTSRVKMPSRIDAAVVEKGKVVVTQK